MIRQALLALVAVICLTRSAAADEMSDRLDAAKALVETMNVKTNAPRIIESMSGAFAALAERQNPGRGGEAAKLVQEEVRPEFEKQMPALIEALARIYAGNYTVDELKALIAFYQTPVGRKSIELQPKIGAEAVSVGGVIGQRALQAAMPRIEQKMHERGLKTPKDT